MFPVLAKVGNDQNCVGIVPIVIEIRRFRFVSGRRGDETRTL